MSLKLHSPHLGVPVIVLLVVSAAAQINPGAIGRKALDDLLAQRFSEAESARNWRLLVNRKRSANPSWAMKGSSRWLLSR